DCFDIQKELSMRLIRVVCLALVGSCSPALKAVPCASDADCDLTPGGVCTLADTGNMWCAYADAACASGLRFSDQSVGDDLGGTCTTGPARHTLTVDIGGTGEGGVTSDPGPLTCVSSVCTGVFNDGAVVHLTAAPTVGSFLGWSKGCAGR